MLQPLLPDRQKNTPAAIFVKDGTGFYGLSALFCCGKKWQKSVKNGKSGRLVCRGAGCFLILYCLVQATGKQDARKLS
jgi:hypothetical protein